MPLTFTTAESLTSGTPACAGVTNGAWGLGLLHGRSLSWDTLHRVTSDIAARVWAHKEGRGSKFCARYGLTRLVYAEEAPTIYEANAREKTIKKWNRAWKIDLIERANPDWDDLWDHIL